jgi:hypothetical protein
MKKLSAVVAIILALAGYAHAADDYIVAASERLWTSVIHGKITVNNYQRFHNAVQANDETKAVLVKLDSPPALFFQELKCGGD